MSRRLDPDAVLDRAEARARRQLDEARERLAHRGHGIVDLPGLIRRHPLTSIAIGAAAGFALLTPARRLPASAARAVTPLRRLLAPLLPIATRALMTALLPED